MQADFNRHSALVSEVAFSELVAHAIRRTVSVLSSMKSNHKKKKKKKKKKQEIFLNCHIYSKYSDKYT